MDGSHRVVVVGGGFAGTTVARGLQQFFQVTMVDTKEFFEFTPSVLRTIVEPERLQRIQVEHAEYLDQTELVVGKVCSLDRATKEVFITRNLEQEVHHEGDHSLSIPYDTLVICSGSYYHTPFKVRILGHVLRLDLGDVAVSQALFSRYAAMTAGGAVISQSP